MTIGTRDDAAPNEHIKDQWNEKPPATLLVVLVEVVVLAPDFLVVVKSRLVTLELLELVGDAPNPPGEECQDSREKSESDTGECFASPCISVLELVDTVHSPDTV